MSGMKEVAGVALTIALGAGTAYAVNEVNELNAEATRIEACVDYNKNHDEPSETCGEEPLALAEATTLRGTAKVTGYLGWAAFIGTVYVGVKTVDQIQKHEPARSRAS